MKQIEKHNVKRIISITKGMMVLLIVGVISCSKDEASPEPQDIPQGSLEELRSFYTDEFVDAMVAIDFNINTGNTPPNIEGSFLISPVFLSESTVEGDTLVGTLLADYLLTFSNQDNENLTIDFKGFQAAQEDNGSGSFVTGSNGAFAVYAKTTTQALSSTAQTAIAISGVLTADGIENIQLFGAMLDDNGDPQDIFITNNTGRLLIDNDGLAVESN